MKPLIVLIALFSVQLAAADSYYDFKNGKTYLCTSTDTPPGQSLPTCSEWCQHFDAFTHTCLYQTSCEYLGSCLRETQCDKFDGFDKRCMSEKQVTSCMGNQAQVAVCASYCQYFDAFTKKCNFQTLCEIRGRCIVSTVCDHWDPFQKQCDATKNTTQCF